jgi:uncharacterized protein Yka (UPF0111/DUF47 family)
MGIQDLVRWLLPKEDHFYDLLERQATIGRNAADALAAFAEEGATANSIAARVQELEHEGDRVVHEVEDALAKTFVTPIDREDIQSLSDHLDDVIDLTNYAARACVLLGVERPSEPMVRLFQILVESTHALADAMPNLRQHRYAELIVANRNLRALEKKGDRVYRSAVSELFRTPDINVRELLREREVLDDLESAIDRCEIVGNVLATLAVKHG